MDQPNYPPPVPSPPIQIESRKYGPDSTPAEIEAIRNRVYVYDEQIVCINEIPVVSPFSINLVMDQAILLGQQFDQFGLLVNVSKTTRPDAVTRRTINTRFAEICNIVPHVSFCTGKNFLLNAAIQFVMHRTNLKSFCVVKDLESGAKAIKAYFNDTAKNQ